MAQEAPLYEVWRADPQSVYVYDPITYPALAKVTVLRQQIPLADQGWVLYMPKHCSTKQNAKYRGKQSDSGSVRAAGHHHGFMPEDASWFASTSSINSRQRRRKAYITKRS
jgi:hypothetical protein